jgi:hypothetical protein
MSMFRNPLYLDVPLLRSLADYHGIELSGDRAVTRRIRDESRRRAGISKGVELGREGEKEDEVTETYALEFRPVRALNDVVDELLRGELIVDLTVDEGQDVPRRSTIQIEGALELSPVTEVGAFMSTVLPSMIEQMAAGAEQPELDPTLIGGLLLGGAPEGVVHVFVMEAGDHRLVVMADPKHLYGDASMDDLDGELTLLATVDRLVADDEAKSLDRYVMPNVNRTMRRMLGGKDLVEMAEGLGEAIGRKIDRDSLTISGPAAIVTPVAIY